MASPGSHHSAPGLPLEGENGRSVLEKSYLRPIVTPKEGQDGSLRRGGILTEAEEQGVNTHVVDAEESLGYEVGTYHYKLKMREEKR